MGIALIVVSIFMQLVVLGAAADSGRNNNNEAMLFAVILAIAAPTLAYIAGGLS